MLLKRLLIETTHTFVKVCKRINPTHHFRSGSWLQSFCICVFRPPHKGNRGEQDSLTEWWKSRQKPEGDEGGHPGYASWDEKKTTGRPEKHRGGWAGVRTHTTKPTNTRDRRLCSLWHLLYKWKCIYENASPLCRQYGGSQWVNSLHGCRDRNRQRAWKKNREKKSFSRKREANGWTQLHGANPVVSRIQCLNKYEAECLKTFLAQKDLNYMNHNNHCNI